MGGILDDDTIPQLKCKIIAGAANNQLAVEKEHGQAIFDNGILYAPDYVINAGGLINVYAELQGYNRQKALDQAEGIYGILTNVFEIAEAEGVPTPVASNKLAEKRIKGIGEIKSIYPGVTKVKK